MTIDCSCDDYDRPEFYVATQPRARKQHRCDECGGSIKFGERYERVSAKWDSYVQKFCTCERCYDLRVWVKNNVPCLCIMHGDMNEEMRNAIDDAWWRAPEETIGLRFGFLRRLVLRDRHNKLAREN